jgi:hypothetical protein
MQSRPRIDGDHDTTCAGHKDTYRILAHTILLKEDNSQNLATFLKF